MSVWSHFGRVPVLRLCCRYPANRCFIGVFGIPGIRGKGQIMGDETAAGQQPSDDQEQAGTEGAGTEGSIYGGEPAKVTPDKGDDPGSIYGGEPAEETADAGDDEGPPDTSIYGG